MTIREIITNDLCRSISEAGGTLDKNAISDDLVLLESGLDSMGFAILVAQLEDALGYDPFVLMEEPVYPQTLGEFVAIYEKFGDHREG